jgi:Rod binding domain-containing protein
MEIGAIQFQRQVKAAELPLEKVAKSSHISDAEKVKEVSRQFEAILLRQILGHAQKGMFGSTSEAVIYQDLVTTEFANKISQAGGMGLAQRLEKELGRELAKQTDGPAPTANVAEAPAATDAKQAIATKPANRFPHLHKQ